MFVLAGPNGAGKSTLYKLLIAPRVSAPFINADEIQAKELKDPSMQASYKAAEIAEQRRQEYLREGKSFVTESTFSHPSKLALIDQAKAENFQVVVYHVSVKSAETSLYRVASRVALGGHDVPPEKVRERYARNGELIRQAAGKADFSFVYDNTRLGAEPALALAMRNGKVVHAGESMPAWASELYSHELNDFVRGETHDIRQLTNAGQSDESLPQLVQHRRRAALSALEALGHALMHDPSTVDQAATRVQETLERLEPGTLRNTQGAPDAPWMHQVTGHLTMITAKLHEADQSIQAQLGDRLHQAEQRLNDAFAQAGHQMPSPTPEP